MCHVSRSETRPLTTYPMYCCSSRSYPLAQSLSLTLSVSRSPFVYHSNSWNFLYTRHGRHTHVHHTRPHTRVRTQLALLDVHGDKTGKRKHQQLLHLEVNYFSLNCRSGVIGRTRRHLHTRPLFEGSFTSVPAEAVRRHGPSAVIVTTRLISYCRCRSYARSPVDRAARHPLNTYTRIFRPATIAWCRCHVDV